MPTETPPKPPRSRPEMVVYDARRGGGKRRIRWKRVALWTFGSLLILLLAIGGVVGYWAHGLVGQISHLDKSTQDAQGDLVQIPTANQAGGRHW